MPRRWLAVGAAVAVLIGLAAVVIGGDLAPSLSGSDPAPPKPSATDPPGFVRFRDAAVGLSIAHPSGWRRHASPDSQVRLLAEHEGASVLVRIAPLGLAVVPETVGAARQITDKLVRAAGEIKLLRRPRRVKLGGLSGYLYLYKFRDPRTKQKAAHAHYFLFRGENMITLVFQAVPADRFVEFAPLFDRIAASLRGQGA